MHGESGRVHEIVSIPAAVAACIAMAVLYVLILYVPSVILRLPPPSSFKSFLMQRFVCAAISTASSLALTAVILPIRSGEASHLLRIYGIRADHSWQAVVYPLSLTSFMYAGSLVLKLSLLLNSLRENHGECSSSYYIKSFVQAVPARLFSIASNILVWRNLVVAPVTEELVFRACMIPLLLCAGFNIYSAVFLCPILFSLAHLNHFMGLYVSHNRSFLKASMIVGLQLGYTVVFGSYASFLFLRTGHLAAPLVAHIFCNYMGLPVLFVGGNRLVTAAFLAGVVAFVSLIFPLTKPELYNDRTIDCHCWHGYCSWN